MAVPANHHQPLREQRDHVDGLGRRREQPDRKIDLLAAQIRKHRLTGNGANANVEPRRHLAQPAHQGWNEREIDIVGRTDNDGARHLRCVERLVRFQAGPQRSQSRCDRIGERLRTGSWPNALGVFDEQLVVREAPQPSERVADRGLRQTQQFAGTADMPFPHQRIEHHQQIQVELRKINFVHDLPYQ